MDKLSLLSTSRSGKMWEGWCRILGLEGVGVGRPTPIVQWCIILHEKSFWKWMSENIYFHISIKHLHYNCLSVILTASEQYCFWNLMWNPPTASLQLDLMTEISLLIDIFKMMIRAICYSRHRDQKIFIYPIYIETFTQLFRAPFNINNYIEKNEKIMEEWGGSFKYCAQYNKPCYNTLCTCSNELTN